MRINYPPKGTLFVMGTAALMYLLALLLPGCAGASLREPTPERPVVACIVKSLSNRMNPRTGGKVLPEIVRTIGVTPADKLMVVRGTYNRKACVEDIDSAACGWLPYEREQITTGALCGRQADAFRELARGDV